jgi:hypothetical protein
MVWQSSSPWGQTIGSGPGASVFGKRVQKWSQPQQPAPRASNRIDFAPPGGGPAVGVASAGGLQADRSDPATRQWLEENERARAALAAAEANRPKPDVDISQKGVGEVAFDQHGSKFFQPGASETWHQQNAGQYAFQRQQASGPMTNNAQTVFNGFRKPNIAREPGYGSYYDNAEKDAVNALNTQLGARGAYGSSVGLGQIGKSITDLRADQARTEADYGLRRLTEQRGWEQLHGELGRNADLSGRSNQDIMGSLARDADSGRDKRLSGGRESAKDADTSRLSGLTGGMTAALAAQGAREGRASIGLEGYKDLSTQLQSTLGDAWDKVLAGDMSMVDAIQSAITAGRASDANYDSSQQGRMLNDALAIVTATASPEQKAAAKAKAAAKE